MELFEEGRRAFEEGVRAQAVPYPDWDRRSAWIRGWYAAEYEHRAHAEPWAASARR